MSKVLFSLNTHTLGSRLPFRLLLYLLMLAFYVLLFREKLDEIAERAMVVLVGQGRAALGSKCSPVGRRWSGHLFFSFPAPPIIIGVFEIIPPCVPAYSGNEVSGALRPRFKLRLKPWDSNA